MCKLGGQIAFGQGRCAARLSEANRHGACLGVIAEGAILRTSSHAARRMARMTRVIQVCGVRVSRTLSGYAAGARLVARALLLPARRIGTAPAAIPAAAAM